MRSLSPSFYTAIGLGVTIVIISVFMLQRYIMNEPPVIHDFTTPDAIEVGSDLEFQVTAHDADGDKLTVSWNISAGLGGLSQDSSYLKEDYYEGRPKRLILRKDNPGQKDTLQRIWNHPNGWVTVMVRVSDGVNAPVTQQKVLKITKSKAQ